MDNVSKEQQINYSELYDQLITKDGELNDSIASFLYYMFPRDLFIRALSLLESNDMMIYVLNVKEDGNLDITSTIQDGTTIIGKQDTDKYADEAGVGAHGIATDETELLLSSIYEEEYRLLYRLIVKIGSDDTPPVYVDIHNWSCSCDEFCEEFHREVMCDTEKPISEVLINDIDDNDKFNDDKFGQLDAHSFSQQRYFKYGKVICSHLLAYSILLRSSLRVLKHFVMLKSHVLLIDINSIDEWLKLHINIVN